LLDNIVKSQWRVKCYAKVRQSYTTIARLQQQLRRNIQGVLYNQKEIINKGLPILQLIIKVKNAKGGIIKGLTESKRKCQTITSLPPKNSYILSFLSRNLYINKEKTKAERVKIESLSSRSKD
jgi:hypothetical protein